jgi:uncharacterized protein with HEPN domain
MPLRGNRGYLWDITEAAKSVLTFIEGKTFAGYQADRTLRSAVEREFILIGEAVTQLEQNFPDVAAHLRDTRHIIASRNLLVHAHTNIASEVVWGVI